MPTTSSMHQTKRRRFMPSTASKSQEAPFSAQPPVDVPFRFGIKRNSIPHWQTKPPKSMQPHHPNNWQPSRVLWQRQSQCNQRPTRQRSSHLPRISILLCSPLASQHNYGRRNQQLLQANPSGKCSSNQIWCQIQKRHRIQNISIPPRRQFHPLGMGCQNRTSLSNQHDFQPQWGRPWPFQKWMAPTLYHPALDECLRRPNDFGTRRFCSSWLHL